VRRRRDDDAAPVRLYFFFVDSVGRFADFQEFQPPRRAAVFLIP
jgi:hypothetical protein